jgi:GGDEF domain-containing protein
LLFVALVFLFYILHRSRVEHWKICYLIDRSHLSNSKLSRYVDLDDLTAAQSRRYLVDRIDSHKRWEAHAPINVDLDEFCVFLKGCDLERGGQVARRFLQAVVEANVEYVQP